MLHNSKVDRMRRADVRQLAPGQLLAAPVTAGSGVVLVQADTPLTDALIARLMELGIDSVLVTDDGPGDAEVTAREAAAVEARFAGHENNAWMAALKKIVLAQLAPAAARPPDA